MGDNWKAGLGNDTIQEIEKAVRQLGADEKYEAKQGTLKNTLQNLRALEENAKALERNLDAVSPLTTSIFHDIGLGDGFRIGRSECRKLKQELRRISDMAPVAASRLTTMYSPFAEEGQGTGSAAGRVSDLQAVSALLGYYHSPGRKLDPPDLDFRNPKDKFAVAVIIALIKHQPDFKIDAYGAAGSIKALLDAVWRSTRRKDRPNWDRAVRARIKIAGKLRENPERKARRLAMAAKRNASSEKF